MNAIANVFGQLLQQIAPRPEARERSNAINSYNSNLVRVWAKLPMRTADGSQLPRMVRPVAIESLSTRMYSLISRATADGVFLVGLVGDNVDSDQLTLTEAKQRLASELDCISHLGFAGKAREAGVDEYVRHLNARLVESGSQYRIQLSANRKSCTISNVLSVPARYVSFDCGTRTE
jgi:hypothetical protein